MLSLIFTLLPLKNLAVVFTLLVCLTAGPFMVKASLLLNSTIVFCFWIFFILIYFLINFPFSASFIFSSISLIMLSLWYFSLENLIERTLSNSFFLYISIEFFFASKNSSFWSRVATLFSKVSFIFISLNLRWKETQKFLDKKHFDGIWGNSTPHQRQVWKNNCVRYFYSCIRNWRYSLACLFQC